MSLLKKVRRYSVFYFLASLCLATPLHAKVFSKDLLQEIAISHIAEQVTVPLEKNVEITALALDSRIPDRVCENEPELVVPNEPPFTIVKMAPVVVATANLARGEVITKSHLSVQMKPSQFVRVQYLDDPLMLIGSRSKRNIRSGMPVLLNQICMVCKGDAVNIYASIKGLRIKTTGIALEDGTLGEQVQIKNKKSGKILNARVDGVESVQVNI